MRGTTPTTLLVAMTTLAACAKGGAATGGTVDAAVTPDSCGDQCDADGDGVVDGNDHCPNTPAGQPVNSVGCSDSQVTPMLNPMFPPYGLAWSSGGDLGRAGGLTWTYTGINRKDHFHIDWVICDDPGTPCGVSLDGPIDSSESWTMSPTGTDLPNGTLVFTNTTHIALDDGSMPALTGRLTMHVTDAAQAVVPFAAVSTLGVTARSGQYGAEIKGTDFLVTAVIEVQDPTTSAWTPFLDYYDAAPTPMAGGQAAVSFGGSFYDD